MHRRLCAILDDVADELAGLSSAAEALQAELAASTLCSAAAPAQHGLASLGRSARPSDELVVALQSLDHVTQTLQCLAGFVARTAAAVGPECQADLGAALGAVWMSKLKRRLAAESAEDDAIDDFEFFEAA